MGLWLKCPDCQELNAPDATACTACGASLVNLPKAKRVYYFGTAPAPAPAAASPPPAAPVSPPAMPAAAVAVGEEAPEPVKKTKGKGGGRKRKK